MFEYVKDAGLVPARAYTKRKKTDLIILHHVQGNMSVQAVHAMHIARGHKGIDYNIYIDKDGTVYWARVQPEAPAAFVIDHLLKRRSPTVYDPRVQWVQEAFLRAGGEYITLLGSAGADGRFGSGTEKAVKSYQRALGLTADGIVGHDTAVSLGAVWQG